MTPRSQTALPGPVVEPEPARRVEVRWPWSRKRGSRGDQTLKAVIQINVLPRPR